MHVFMIIGLQAGDKYSSSRGPYIFNCFILLPVVVFFLLDQPHDCFICLGKDPDAIYSTYQLSLEERYMRHMVAKFSKDGMDIVDRGRFFSVVLSDTRGRFKDRNLSIDGLVHHS